MYEMFSQILESLKDCKRGDEFFSLGKENPDKNWIHIYDS